MLIKNAMEHKWNLHVRSLLQLSKRITYLYQRALYSFAVQRHNGMR
jgi:hypothetical protein